MLARGAAAEVIARNKDLRTLELVRVEDEVVLVDGVVVAHLLRHL